ncbi:HD domain-containing protein [Paenibacillus sp. LjRoot153]|uniref:HD-GYP domain-containing protein n=1 Tax=Paenibacillus sp. LjRoot153 TaxID=3342270 RepID=UPI003ECEBA9F
MRLISINEYDETSMQLAKPVYDAKLRVLLAAGNTIHTKYLERLKEVKISHLIVEDKISEGITLEELLDMPTWLEVIKTVELSYDMVKIQKPIPLKSLLQCVGRLIVEMKIRPILLPVPITVIVGELKTYAHAVNVTLMALQIGKYMGYNDLQLRDLAVGCLLHDIGKAVTDDTSKHPEEGFNILRSVREISLLSAHVAFQHHETIDGLGYPRSLEGQAVHDYAQICALANLYDNLISDEEFSPHEAIEVIMGQYGRTYAEQLVQAFVKSIPPYPPGTKIQLNDGQEAIVTRIGSHMQRPDIRNTSNQIELSLAENSTLIIVGTL